MRLIQIDGKPPTELFPAEVSAKPILSGKWLITDFYGADGAYYQRRQELGRVPELVQWYRLDGFRLPSAPPPGDKEA